MSGLDELQPGDPRRIGPYWLEGRLGAGGMGRVYLGRSPGGRHVAVKAIRAELAESADFRTRFAREVSAARRVSGIFTAPVVDADLDGPVPWLATSYVSGPSLASAVATGGPMSADAVLALAAGLAEGLSAIHAAGVVHRDLKPSNVIVADDEPRVLDFGISLSAEASALTQTGMVVGSPGFMSPEQADGHDVGPPSDIFSLGAVLAFAATGQGPFGTGPTAALVYRVVHSEPDTGALPDEIRPLIERCLAKDPQHRPTAGQTLAKSVPGARPRAHGLLPPGPAPGRRGWRPPACGGKRPRRHSPRALRHRAGRSATLTSRRHAGPRDDHVGGPAASQHAGRPAAGQHAASQHAASQRRPGHGTRARAGVPALADSRCGGTRARGGLRRCFLRGPGRAREWTCGGQHGQRRPCSQNEAAPAGGLGHAQFPAACPGLRAGPPVVLFGGPVVRRRRHGYARLHTWRKARQSGPACRLPSTVCGPVATPTSGEATIQQAIVTRQRILSELPALSPSAVPHGAQLVSDLSAAMQNSLNADHDYQSWMADPAASGGCGSAPPWTRTTRPARAPRSWPPRPRRAS